MNDAAAVRVYCLSPEFVSVALPELPSALPVSPDWLPEAVFDGRSSAFLNEYSSSLYQGSTFPSDVPLLVFAVPSHVAVTASGCCTRTAFSPGKTEPSRSLACVAT